MVWEYLYIVPVHVAPPPRGAYVSAPSAKTKTCCTPETAVLSLSASTALALGIATKEVSLL